MQTEGELRSSMRKQFFFCDPCTLEKPKHLLKHPPALYTQLDFALLQVLHYEEYICKVLSVAT